MVFQPPMGLEEFFSIIVAYIDLVFAKNFLEVQQFPQFLEAPRIRMYVFRFLYKILSVFVFSGLEMIRIDF